MKKTAANNRLQRQSKSVVCTSRDPLSTLQVQRNLQKQGRVKISTRVNSLSKSLSESPHGEKSAMTKDYNDRNAISRNPPQVR